MDWDLGDISKITVFNGPNKSSNVYKIDSNTKLLQQKGTPTIITFPRAGRHWLMLALECYFRESISYDDSPWSNNCLPEKILFVHEDPIKDIPINNYICMYRKNIVSCVFSYMWKEQVFAYTPDNINRVEELRKERASIEYLNKYLDFVIKWFITYHPSFNNRNVFAVTTFETMCTDLSFVIKLVCEYLNEPFKIKEAQRVIKQCTKEEVASLVEPFEVNLTSQYKLLQKQFIQEYHSYIMNYLLEKEPRLIHVLN